MSVSSVSPGTADVHLRLDERYVCKRHSHEGACRHGRVRHFHRRDIVYLRHTPTGWRLSQPSAALRDVLLPDPDYSEELLFPPVRRRDLRRLARSLPPPLPCKGPTVSAGDQVGERSLRAYPWSDMHSVSITRTGPGRVCASIELGAPPRATSTFSVEEQQNDGPYGGSGYGIDVTVDTRGVIHEEGNGFIAPLPVLGPRRRVGWNGHALQFDLSGLERDKPLVVYADAAFAAFGVYLFSPRPYREDSLPRDACLQYPGGRLIVASGGPCMPEG